MNTAFDVVSGRAGTTSVTLLMRPTVGGEETDEEADVEFAHPKRAINS